MIRILSLSFSLLLAGGVALGQTVPDVSLKDIEGNSVQTADLVQEEGPTVYCFGPRGAALASENSTTTRSSTKTGWTKRA